MSDPQLWLPWAIGVRLACIALTLALGRTAPAARRAAFLGSILASVLSGGAGAAVLLGGVPLEGHLLTHAASGLALGYRIDALSAWFLVVLAALAVPIAVYSLGYFAHGKLAARSTFAGVAFNVLLAAVEWVFAANGIITFVFAWELMTLANAALVVTDHEDRESRRAAFLYLAMSHVGTGCIVAALLSAGGTWAPGSAFAAPASHVCFLLFLAGFGVKAGIVPLHVWLPEAHPAAPSSISALMSGVVIKTGVYGLVRFCAFGLGTPRLGWGVVVVLLGAASAILGVLYALMQHDLKRLLAYHSIENIGIILLGLGASMMALSAGRGELAAIGLAAALFHVLNHAVFKGLLFLGAGGVVEATGTRQIEELGGLARRMPWTALFFLVGAAAISGLPLLNGFASEWLVFQALLFGFHSSGDAVVRFLYPVAGALLALTTALAAACFVKAFGISFLALPRSDAARRAHESPRAMLLPQAALATLCLALGLLPGLPLLALEQVTASLPGVVAPPGLTQGAFAIASGAGRFDQLQPLLAGAAVGGALALATLLLALCRFAVRRAPTWGCGGELGAGNEYTATAFSKPLMLVFAAIYRPTREVSAVGDVSPYFPREVRYHAEIEPTFERFVYGPLTRTVVAAAERLKVIQAGSLHAYLAYVIALVLCLVVLVWWRG